MEEFTLRYVDLRYLLILFLLSPCVSWGAVTGFLEGDSTDTPAGDCTNPDSVLLNDAKRASFEAPDETLWVFHYSANFGADSIIVDSLQVRLDGYRTDSKEAFRLTGRLSMDDGVSWSDSQVSVDIVQVGSEVAYYLIHDDWGETWTYSACDSIAVQLRTSVFGATIAYLEYCAVRIFYSLKSGETSSKGLNVDDKLGAGKGMID